MVYKLPWYINGIQNLLQKTSTDFMPTGPTSSSPPVVHDVARLHHRPKTSKKLNQTILLQQNVCLKTIQSHSHHLLL